MLTSATVVQSGETPADTLGGEELSVRRLRKDVSASPTWAPLSLFLEPSPPSPGADPRERGGSNTVCSYRRRNTMVRHQQRDHQGGISGVWVVQDPALADVSWNHGTQQLALPHAPPPPPPNPPPLLPLVSGLPQQPASSATGSFGSPVSPESVTSAAGSFGGPPVTTAGGPFVESPVTSDASSFQTSTHTFAHPTAAPDSLEQQLSMYNFGQAAHQAQQHHQVPLVHHHHHHQSPTGPGGSNHLMHHGGSMPAEPSYIRYFNPNFPAAVGGPQALGGFHHFQWSPDEVKPEEEFEMPNHRLRLSLI